MRIGTVAVGVVACLTVAAGDGRARAASVDTDPCSARAIAEAARLADRLLRAEASAASRGEPPNPVHVARARDNYARRVARIESSSRCSAPLDAAALQQEVEGLAGDTAEILEADRVEPDGRSCVVQAIRAVGRRTRRVMGARVQELRTGQPLSADQLVRTEELFETDMARVASLGGCVDPRQEQELKERVDEAADFIAREVERAARARADDAREAEGAKSASVVRKGAEMASGVAALAGVAVGSRSGGDIRTWRRKGAEGPPQAVLLLIPGAPGGVAGLGDLAEALVGASGAADFDLAVWALAKSEPAPDRVDEGVQAARRLAGEAPVSLGGRGEGAAFAGRYAAWSFGEGDAARPGHAGLRGLVLLEGGGGALPSAPRGAGASAWPGARQPAARDIDVPVIAFHGSGGTPRDFLPLARSIGACAVSPCDGSPRVADPDAAAATAIFAGASGGFEVHEVGSLSDALLAFLRRSARVAEEAGD